MFVFFIGNCKVWKLWKVVDIKEDLVVSVVLFVCWYDMMEVMYEMGIRLYIEMVLGRVLMDLVVKSFFEVRVILVVEFMMKILLILMEKEKM